MFVGGIGDGGNFASFDLDTGATRWLGGTDGNVQAIALYDGIVYVGGHYENYCGAAPGTHLCPTPTPRSKALAIGSLTGLLQPWHPVVNSVLGIFALAGGSGYLAVGGDFTRIGGRQQQGFAIFPGAADLNGGGVWESAQTRRRPPGGLRAAGGDGNSARA